MVQPTDGYRPGDEVNFGEFSISPLEIPEPQSLSEVFNDSAVDGDSRRIAQARYREINSYLQYSADENISGTDDQAVWRPEQDPDSSSEHLPAYSLSNEPATTEVRRIPRENDRASIQTVRRRTEPVVGGASSTVDARLARHQTVTTGPQLGYTGSSTFDDPPAEEDDGLEEEEQLQLRAALELSKRTAADEENYRSAIKQQRTQLRLQIPHHPPRPRGGPSSMADPPVVDPAHQPPRRRQSQQPDLGEVTEGAQMDGVYRTQSYHKRRLASFQNQWGADRTGEASDTRREQPMDNAAPRERPPSKPSLHQAAQSDTAIPRQMPKLPRTRTESLGVRSGNNVPQTANGAPLIVDPPVLNITQVREAIEEGDLGQESSRAAISSDVTDQIPSPFSGRPSTIHTSERTPFPVSPPSIDSRSRSPMNLPVPEPSRGRRSSHSSANKFTVREGSRHPRETSGTRLGQVCDQCEKKGPNCFFCNVCKNVLCDNCWSQQLVHKTSSATQSIPHEKTELSVARKVQEVLTPRLTDEDREKLHAADIDTTWFGVVRPDDDLPLFRDYGRYATLVSDLRAAEHETTIPLSATSDHNETLYPSLVSFVGQTGAGKSTLIKLLINLKSREDEAKRFPTPIVGAAGKDVSTSEDVHLYLDPDSSESQVPILFADCEGLEGGERDPVGARLKRKLEKEAKRAAGLGAQEGQRPMHTSERELLWARSARTRSRDYAVAHLYPRLLYTFSDVIVFVLRNARTAEGVLERLVDWAQAALEKSSNQPVLPHAIIALNASENNIPDEFWDPETATKSLLSSLASTVDQNPTFKKFAQFWRLRDRQITTVEELLLSYYSSFKVIRIPADGRPNLIRGQVEKLSGMIRLASKESRDRKADLRMLLDADELQPYLQYAFDHFAEGLDTPFDFVQASFTNSPIPNDFGGNILKIALQVMECWKNLAKGMTIFEELSYLIASCIMLDAARNRIRGADEQIFPQYLEHLDNALENFCDRHWPCEFLDPQHGRCVNVRSGHSAKGHQSKAGKLLADGSYKSDFSFETHRPQFQADTYHKLQLLRARAKVRMAESGSEVQAAALVHRESVLPQFFEHASQSNIKEFSSHTVCLCCLFEPPEHALPCGHILCTPCLEVYGKKSPRGLVEISECPLEREHFRKPWQVYLKPADCGVRVLTLDGGGVRGIVELEILQQLQKELGGSIHIQSFFDLIIGTSTGGIVALGLTARNWTLDECLRQFKQLCEKAFTLRKGGNIPLVSWIVSNHHHSKYETTPLEAALTEAFGKDQYLFGGSRSESSSMDVKVAVTATSAASNTVLLSNYNRLCSEKLSYHFQRPEKLHGELKTWEAARATSAAVTYFRPFVHDSSKQVYSDGGIFYNNPVAIADRERKLIWPSQQDEEPDVLVSVGTACSKQLKEKQSLEFPSRGIIANKTFQMKLAQDHVKMSLDCERAWRDYLNARAPIPAHKGRYIRVNPEVEEPLAKLDSVSQIGHLQEITRHKVGSSMEIQNLARRLVATCFYFTTDGTVREDSKHKTLEVSGNFRCRLLLPTEVAELGKFIKGQATAGHPAHFLIKEEGNDTDYAQEVLFDSEVLGRMITDRIFRMKTVTIRRRSRFSRTEILLCYRRDTMVPISRFPRSLHADKPTLTTHRHILASANSLRWAGRTPSQQERKVHWQPPRFEPLTKDSDLIERFSNADHLLGNATQRDLMNYTLTSGAFMPPSPLELDARTPDQQGGTSSLPFRQNAEVYDRVEPRSVRHEDHIDAQASTVHANTGSYPFSPESISQQERHSNIAIELPTESEGIYYRARDDWTGQTTAHLSVRKGDLIKILEFGENGWWLGRLAHDTRRGWLPPSWLVLAEPNARSRFESSELDDTSQLPERLGASYRWIQRLDGQE